MLVVLRVGVFIQLVRFAADVLRGACHIILLILLCLGVLIRYFLLSLQYFLLLAAFHLLQVKIYLLFHSLLRVLLKSVDVQLVQVDTLALRVNLDAYATNGAVHLIQLYHLFVLLCITKSFDLQFAFLNHLLCVLKFHSSWHGEAPLVRIHDRITLMFLVQYYLFRRQRRVLKCLWDPGLVLVFVAALKDLISWHIIWTDDLGAASALRMVDDHFTIMRIVVTFFQFLYLDMDQVVFLQLYRARPNRLGIIS